jgi:hypothetical protein
MGLGRLKPKNPKPTAFLSFSTIIWRSVTVFKLKLARCRMMA